MDRLEVQTELSQNGIIMLFVKMSVESVGMKQAHPQETCRVRVQTDVLENQ